MTPPTSTAPPAPEDAPPAAEMGPTPAQQRAAEPLHRQLVARLPTEELPGIVTGLVLVGLVGVTVAGWAAPTTAITLGVGVAGLRTLFDARRGALPSGLVVGAGLVALVLTACWWAGTDLDHAPGWRTERPEAGLATYEMAVGNLTVDLTESPRPVGVEAQVGVGRVIVKVPEADIRAGRVLVRARVGGGWASVPVPRPDDPIRPIGRDAGPLVAGEARTRPGAEPPIVVDVAVGVGSVEVHRVR